MGERVRVSVADTGIGISAEDLVRLARPFEQIESQHSKTQQGTGLGLALTKSLVEMHGGVLEMESEPGHGTTVSFILPVRQSQAWPRRRTGRWLRAGLKARPMHWQPDWRLVVVAA